ncbi:L,D-transpeptidase family protein [Sulfurovum sp. ST-21]|uniref:L,D-transpeptidase family protein n=1 Tax=Sulfurovum indicum TaxID=2779528 RepID=A0A7M1S4F6_9BACT|nr:L,D-transpeptidase family protein [Sulfurovum indicum]QOR61881.1 L,D-transpeptidase family protein [Sulfurovum indicum]
MQQSWKQARLWLGTAVMILSLHMTPLYAGQMAFEEHATDVIFNSLKTQPSKSFLKRFYKELLFLPVWMQEKGLSSPAKGLFGTMQEDFTLDPESKLYRDARLLYEEAQNLYLSQSTFLQKMEMEFKISLLYKAYIDYAYFGSINWGAFQARISNLKVNGVSTEWVLHRPDVDPVKMVERALLGGDMKKELQAAVPTAYHYRALQKALKHYMDIEADGGWQRVVLHRRKLDPGSHDEGVYSLRERLKVTGDYTGCSESVEGELYDGCLQEAVRHFQKRNGLKPDGVVGPATLRALNTPVSERIATIRLNLDRIKWLNPRQPHRHIIINIPFFTLYFEENGKLIQSMKVITGKPNHPTPIFSDEVEIIVLNPYWNVPKSIVQKEMIPKLLRNPYAMRKEGIDVYTGWGRDARKIDPASVNWAAYRYSKHLPYRFAQPPGYRNALGKIKFLFPNRFSVYMHDTPTKPLFKREKRAFSHGCVRLEKPRELFRTFAAFEENIDLAKSEQILQGKKNVHMRLSKKVPVDIVYLTAWVDYDGKLQFRDDVYHYDRMQLQSYKRW